MDISGIAALSTSMSQTAVQQQTDISVLKKSLDIQNSTAQALINVIPQVPSTAGLPDNVGRNINTTA